MQNVLEVDVEARTCGPEVARLLQFITGFDFATAFPSVGWRWLFAVLKAVKVPLGIISIC